VADLEAAMEARHPSRLPKHLVMMAASSVIVENGKLLMVRDLQGFWAGVGGWLEPGETPEQAALRELHEELGVTGVVTRVFRPFLAWDVREQDPPVSFLLFPFGVALTSREMTPDPTEVTEVRWVTRAELSGLDRLPQIRAIHEQRLDEWMA
jgi:8-oxo-dGTP diphosphatase